MYSAGGRIANRLPVCATSLPRTVSVAVPGCPTEPTERTNPLLARIDPRCHVQIQPMRLPQIVAVLLTAGTAMALAADDYAPSPDSLPREGVPKGDVTKYTFDQSKIFPGTTRDYWVYVPKQYDAAKPAPVMVSRMASCIARRRFR